MRSSLPLAAPIAVGYRSASIDITSLSGPVRLGLGQASAGDSVAVYGTFDPNIGAGSGVVPGMFLLATLTANSDVFAAEHLLAADVVPPCIVLVRLVGTSAIYAYAVGDVGVGQNANPAESLLSHEFTFDVMSQLGGSSHSWEIDLGATPPATPFIVAAGLSVRTLFAKGTDPTDLNVKLGTSNVMSSVLWGPTGLASLEIGSDQTYPVPAYMGGAPVAIPPNERIRVRFVSAAAAANELTAGKAMLWVQLAR